MNNVMSGFADELVKVGVSRRWIMKKVTRAAKNPELSGARLERFFRNRSNTHHDATGDYLRKLNLRRTAEQMEKKNPGEISSAWLEGARKAERKTTIREGRLDRQRLDEDDRLRAMNTLNNAKARYRTPRMATLNV